jgi:hypothetical protein
MQTGGRCSAKLPKPHGELGARVEFTDLDDGGRELVGAALRCRFPLTGVEIVEGETA